MQRPRSLQLTLPSGGASTHTSASASASPGVEAMEENEPLTSPAKADGGGSANGEHPRTPTNDITNIAAGPDSIVTTQAAAPTSQPPTFAAAQGFQLETPVPILPPTSAMQPPSALPPTAQARRPARPSSLLLVTPAGQWAPPPQSASKQQAAMTSTAASPALATARQPQSRRPTSLCLPSRWTPAESGGQQPPPPQAAGPGSATPATPTLPTPSPLGVRRPAPFPELPPAVKRLRPSGSGLAFPPSTTSQTAAATPSSELPPSPFPPPTPSSTLTLSSTSTPSVEPAAVAVVEDAEMASPTDSTTSSTMSSSFQLGLIKPYWVPDRDAPLCMQCGARFTVLRRRHHCRACGRVLCSACASHTARLAFLGGAKARVCAACHQQLTLPPPLPPPPPQPSATAPLLQRQPGAPKPATTAAVQPQLPPRCVVFSDGTRPGLAAVPDVAIAAADSVEGLEPSLAPLDGSQLPPLCHQSSSDSADPEAALAAGRTLHYRVCRSVRVSARLLQSLPCCTPPGSAWWLLISRGLFTVGQAEVFLLIQRSTGEALPPAHVFALIYSVYERAFSGGWVRHLDYLPAPRRLGPLLRDRSHAGFLLFQPSRLHCTLHLGLPAAVGGQPLLCGLLVLRWEAPWAELFPMRLLLRLGCEQRVYPCPLTSVRQRAPVFGELGRSLAGLLVDTRNFSHGLPSPPGLSVRLRTGCTSVRCPVEAYDAVQKALAAASGSSTLSSCGSWVMAFGASFCSAAEAHLVCYQNLETGEYGTRAISIEGRQLSVTAASFVVFNGGGGAFAQNRVSIVEDGVLVQLADEQMARLRDALRSMRPWSAVCSAADSSGDLVEFVWQPARQDDQENRLKTSTTADNAGSGDFSNSDCWLSLVDGQPLTACRTIRLTPGSQRPVRCTRLHALREGDLADGSPVDSLRWANRLAGAVASAVASRFDNAGGAELAETVDNPTVDQTVVEKVDGLPDEFGVRVSAGSGQGATWTGGRRVSQLPSLVHSLESALRPLLTELDRLLASDLALELVFATTRLDDA